MVMQALGVASTATARGKVARIVVQGLTDGAGPPARGVLAAGDQPGLVGGADVVEDGLAVASS